MQVQRRNTVIKTFNTTPLLVHDADLEKGNYGPAFLLLFLPAITMRVCTLLVCKRLCEPLTYLPLVVFSKLH